MSTPEALEHGLAVRDTNRNASPLQTPGPREPHNVSANIGKRRALAGPLLSSPARQGHATRMAEIYSNARANLDGISELSASPRRYQSTKPSSLESGEVKYPVLPLKSRSASDLDNDTLACNANGDSEFIFPVLSWTHGSALGSPQRGRRLSRDAKNHSVRTPPSRLCPLRRDVPYSTETLKPERYYANLGRPLEPPQSDSVLSEVSSKSEGSSASWTGDSEFYYSKPQPLPLQQRQCSVSEWLERLPASLEKLGHADSGTDVEKAAEDVEDDDAQKDGLSMSSLSPHVELQRGTVRRRRVEKQARQRCASYDDEDILGSKEVLE